MKKTLIMLAGVSAIACASAEPEDLQAFPAADDGMERHVIRVPSLGDDEGNYRIEVLIGKELEVDCNRYSFGATLTAATVSGWGYTYYSVDKIGGPMSTMMACPDEPMRMEFVTASLENPLLRYNSKLPLVVYLPEGFELRYRIWAASAETLSSTRE